MQQQMCVCVTQCVCVCVARKSPGRGRKSHDVGKCLMHPTSRKRNFGNYWEREPKRTVNAHKQRQLMSLGCASSGSFCVPARSKQRQLSVFLVCQPRWHWIFP